jgi:hypothetical protein
MSQIDQIERVDADTDFAPSFYDLATPDLLQLSTHDLVQTLVRTLLDGPSEAVRDLKPRTPSVGEMHALYERGATLGEVGARAGISAERVSRLFKKAGLRTRSKAQIDELRRQAIALRVHERRDALVEGFRDGRSAAALAAEHKLPVFVVREIIAAEIPSHELRALRHRPVPKRYADHELLGFLREAGAARGGALTIAFYNDFAHGRHTADSRSWPTHQTHAKRFGSWLKALHAAGIQANEQRAGCGMTFGADHCIDAIRAVHQQLGKMPTAREYTQCARDSAGSLPSRSTIHNRCGGSWLAALHAASVKAGLPGA